MDAPPRASSVLASLAGKARLSEDDVARALAAGQQEFGGQVELAIEALWVGSVPLQRAVELARRSALPEPTEVEAHAAFLTPSARRGPLQAALAALAIHRLHTLVWPADPSWPITSRFGLRVHPVTGKPSFHNGTDVGAPVGTPLVAVHRGTVRRTSRDSVSGNYLVIDHGLGLETTFCHLSTTSVDEGARVGRGEAVATSGVTGRATGPHLHYILRVGGEAVDATRYGGAPPTSSPTPSSP